MHFCFFFNDTATTEIYTLSLHDALPILLCAAEGLEHRLPLKPGRGVQRAYDAVRSHVAPLTQDRPLAADIERDRKSTRLNSSHANISYAVFCLKKKHIPCRLHDPQIQSY